MSESKSTTAETNSSNNDESNNLRVKCLVQQCTKARLDTRLADKEKNIEPEYVQVTYE